jgi:hypothetical protein
VKTREHRRQVAGRQQVCVGRVVVSAHGTRGCLPFRRPWNEVKVEKVGMLICGSNLSGSERDRGAKRGLECKKGPTVGPSATMPSIAV